MFPVGYGVAAEYIIDSTMKGHSRNIKTQARAAVSMMFVVIAVQVSSAQTRWEYSITRNDHVGYELACHENGTCIATIAEGVGLTSYVMRSTDRGHNWTRVHEDVARQPRRWPLRLGKVLFLSPSEILITADSGYLLRSFDAGESWIEELIAGEAISGGAGDISIGPDGSGIVSIDRQLVQPEPFPERLFATRDSGHTWSEIQGNLRETKNTAVSPVNFVRALSPGEFLVGFTETFFFDPPESQNFDSDSSLVFAHSSDGGVNWTFAEVKHDSIVTLRVPSMTFFDDRHGVLTGLRRNGRARGAILRTENAGRSWEVFDVGVGRESEFTGVLHSQFISFDSGYGNIIGQPVRTIDGGLTWTRDSIQPDPDIGFNPILRSLMFSDSVGVALSQSGAFYVFDPAISSVGVEIGSKSTTSVVWDRDQGPLEVHLAESIGELFDARWFDVSGQEVDGGSVHRGSTPNSILIDPIVLTSGFFILRISDRADHYHVRVVVR